MNIKTGMIETLRLNREQTVDMLGTDVDSLSEETKDACNQHELQKNGLNKKSRRWQILIHRNARTWTGFKVCHQAWYAS